MGKTAKASVLVMTAPIRDAQGQVIGALAGSINLSISNFLDDSSQSHYGKTGHYLLVAPQHRLIVTATDKHRVMEAFPAVGVFPTLDRFMSGFEGSTVYVSMRGEELLTSHKTVPITGWYVAATLPTAEAFLPIRNLQRRLLLQTIVLALLASGLTWWILRRQLSPMIAGFNHLLDKLAKRETALRASEEHFRLIFENSGEAVLFTWPDGRIESANPAACRLFGCGQEEFRRLGRRGLMDTSDPRLPAALAERRRQAWTLPWRTALPPPRRRALRRRNKFRQLCRFDR